MIGEVDEPCPCVVGVGIAVDEAQPLHGVDLAGDRRLAHAQRMHEFRHRDRCDR